MLFLFPNSFITRFFCCTMQSPSPKVLVVVGGEDSVCDRQKYALLLHKFSCFLDEFFETLHISLTLISFYCWYKCCRGTSFVYFSYH